MAKINVNFAEAAERKAKQMLAENARKVLAAELEAAHTAELRLQNSADSAKARKESADVDSGTLWNKYRDIIEHGKEKGLEPFEIDAAMVDSLVKINKDDKAASTNTINMYRSVSRRYMVVLFDAEGFAPAVNKAGVSLKNSDGSTKPVGFTDAKKVIKEYTRTDEERKFDALVSTLSEKLREAVKNQAAKKKEGIPALEGRPLSEMIALVSEMLQLIPQRKVKAETVEKSAADDANAAAEEADTEADTGNVQVAHAA